MTGLAARRRWLTQMAQNNVIGDTIYGSDLVWAQGSLDGTTGEHDPNSSNSYVIYTPNYINVSSVTNKAFSYSEDGVLNSSNDVPFYSYIYQYDSSKTFIQRDLVLHNSSGRFRIATKAQNCKYVRFIYGHNQATEEHTIPSEGNGAIFTIVPLDNFIVPGEYVSRGTAVGNAVDNNIVFISKLPKNASTNYITPYFAEPIKYNNGDILRIVGIKKSGSITNGTNINIYINSKKINSSYISFAGFDISYTYTADTTVSYVNFSNSSNTATGTNYSIQLQIYKNGEQVI